MAPPCSTRLVSSLAHLTWVFICISSFHLPSDLPLLNFGGSSFGEGTPSPPGGDYKTARQQGPPGSHRARDTLTTRSNSVRNMIFLGDLLLEKQDGLLAPKRRRLACSTQASRRMRSPAPPGLPRALSDLCLPQDG